MRSIENQNHEMVKLVLLKMRNMEKIVSVRNDDGLNSLEMTLNGTREEFAKSLHSNNINITIIRKLYPQLRKKYPPREKMIITNRHDLYQVELIINTTRSKQIRYSDIDGVLPQRFTSKKEKMTLLLLESLTLEIFEKHSLCHWACKNGHKLILEYGLSHRLCGPNELSFNATTMLYEALEFPGLVQLLLQNGADADYFTKPEFDPVMAALTRHDSFESFEALWFIIGLGYSEPSPELLLKASELSMKKPEKAELILDSTLKRISLFDYQTRLYDLDKSENKMLDPNGPWKVASKLAQEDYIMHYKNES